jgi:hypothetical protein
MHGHPNYKSGSSLCDLSCSTSSLFVIFSQPNKQLADDPRSIMEKEIHKRRRRSQCSLIRTVTGSMVSENPTVVTTSNPMLSRDNVPLEDSRSIPVLSYSSHV